MQTLDHRESSATPYDKVVGLYGVWELNAVLANRPPTNPLLRAC